MSSNARNVIYLKDSTPKLSVFACKFIIYKLVTKKVLLAILPTLCVNWIFAKIVSSNE